MRGVGVPRSGSLLKVNLPCQKPKSILLSANKAFTRTRAQCTQPELRNAGKTAAQDVRFNTRSARQHKRHTATFGQSETRKIGVRPRFGERPVLRARRMARCKLHGPHKCLWYFALHVKHHIKTKALSTRSPLRERLNLDRQLEQAVFGPFLGLPRKLLPCLSTAALPNLPHMQHMRAAAAHAEPSCK